jgi:hypothetical protein
MDLYNFTGWGFFITIVLVLSLGAYIRQFFLAFITDFEKLHARWEKRFDELERTVDGIARHLGSN